MSIHVKNNIHWVGQRDWEVRDFHGTEYKTHKGTSYNSYLIREGKNVLIDTVDHKFSREFVQNLAAEIDLSSFEVPSVFSWLAKTGGVGSSGFASQVRFNNLNGGTVDSGTGTINLQTQGAHAGVFNILGNGVQFNAGAHGFRLSYPRDNPHGIVYEPWHWCWHPPRG